MLALLMTITCIMVIQKDACDAHSEQQSGIRVALHTKLQYRSNKQSTCASYA